MEPTTLTVITDGEVTLAGHRDGDALLLDVADLPVATGWELKPEGLCQGDVCVPVRDRSALLVRGPGRSAGGGTRGAKPPERVDLGGLVSGPGRSPGGGTRGAKPPERVDLGGLVSGPGRSPGGGTRGAKPPERVDLGAMAAAVRRPFAAEPAAGLAVLGTSAAEAGAALSSLRAPDFTLPDVAGSDVALRDFAGKKRLLVAFASW